MASNIWIWEHPEIKLKDKVFDYVKNANPLEKDVAFIHSTKLYGFSGSLPLTNVVLNMGRYFKLVDEEHATFLSFKDHIKAVDLCLTRGKGDDGVEIFDDDVIECHKNYLHSFEAETKEMDKNVQMYKEFLSYNNCTNLWLLYHNLKKYMAENSSEIKSYLANRKFIVLGLPESEIYKQLLSILAHNTQICNLKFKGDSTLEIYTDVLKFEEISINENTENHSESATEEYASNVIVAFLTLLINSRNELALSKALVSPVIDLSHVAFTALKHLATEKEMPMCQTAISYVTKIRLGGKGYAPSKTCPLLPHLKGLEKFVDTLNQLQTVIEEDSSPISAIKRLITILKNKLLKSGSDKLRTTSVESIADALIETALKVAKLVPQSDSQNSSQLGREAFELVYNFVNYINCDDWCLDPKAALAKDHLKRTPLNLPPLLGYFRSPEEDSCSTSTSLLTEDNSQLSVIELQVATPVSYFHNTESNSVSSCVNSRTPKKMSFKGCLKAPEDSHRTQNNNSGANEDSNSAPKPKSRKRSILGEITNQNSAKKTNSDSSQNCIKKSNEKAKANTTAASKTTKQSKSKLIEGQGKITNFFGKGK